MEEKHNSPATATEFAQPSSAEPPSSRRRGGGLKRKASALINSNTSTPPPSSSSKRQTREKPSPVLFPPIHNGPLTRARLQPNYAESTNFWDAVVVDGDGEAPVLATPAGAKAEEELNARREAWEALEAKIEAEYDSIKSRDANVHVVPISSGWFSWTKVHQLEEKALPSFFNGKFENRSPEIYMDIRNSIMKRFHANPNTQIEEKDLSEIEIGELDAKKEVMEFLDYWGLINYHPFTEAHTASSVVDAEEAAKVNSLIQKLYEFEVEKLCSPPALRSSFTTPAVASRLPESIITDDSVQREGPSVEYHCNSCAADCSRKRYHCQKQADFDLCSECFNAGKFDTDMAPSDFILMEPGDAAGASSGKWTDQETLLLLEALELFNENWNEIAEHVATKTKAQCILHFVQMPIEDTFRDCDDEVDASHKEKTEKKDASPDENDEKKEDGEDKLEVDEENDGSQDTKETKTPLNNDNPDSSPMEVSELVDNNKVNDIQENGLNVAVKALREAFEAVGSPPSLDEKLSFVDAGNPVMAMAAFLTRLVEPNIVTASARTCLKSVSSGGTGLQLSARHSFLIEAPTDEKKPDDTQRDVVEQKNTDSCRKQEEDKEDTNVVEIEEEKSSEKKEDKVAAEVVVSKKGRNAGTRRKGVSKKDKDPVTEKPVIVEETNNKVDETNSQVDENPSSSKKETEDSGGSVVPSQSTEATKKDEEMAEPPQSALPENAANSEDTAAEDTKNLEKPPPDSKNVEKPQPDAMNVETPPPDTMNVEKPPPDAMNVEKPPADSMNVEKPPPDTKNVEKPPADTKNDPSMNNLTRAAVTAISAAAVKAKFLADQEEDQIRQLATSLVEKQLQKLESKLTFFTEMDGVISRAREQLERSKQKLYYERAQIIAARLGMSSAASARPMPHPLPNRPGPTFPNAVPRPPNPMNMTPQRPPLSRPMMAPTPPFPNPVAPATNAGNSTQISNNQGMK